MILLLPVKIWMRNHPLRISKYLCPRCIQSYLFLNLNHYQLFLSGSIRREGAWRRWRRATIKESSRISIPIIRPFSIRKTNLCFVSHLPYSAITVDILDQAKRINYALFLRSLEYSYLEWRYVSFSILESSLFPLAMGRYTRIILRWWCSRSFSA